MGVPTCKGRRSTMFFSRICAMNISRSLLAVLGACLIFGHAANAADPAPTPVNSAAQAPRAPDNEAALIERGKYVAHLGDCVACHTANKGPAMAGGLELKTPMG